MFPGKLPPTHSSKTVGFSFCIAISRSLMKVDDSELKTYSYISSSLIYLTYSSFLTILMILITSLSKYLIIILAKADDAAIYITHLAFPVFLEN